MRKKSVVGFKTALMTIFGPMSQDFAMMIFPNCDMCIECGKSKERGKREKR